MKTSRPDPVVRALTVFASSAYYFMWIGGAFILTALPLIKAFGGNGGGFSYDLELPLIAPNLETMVQTVWGPAPLTLDEVRGELQLPISAMPWSFLALLWAYTALAGTLMLTFLHNLRRIFQRVRDGAAFDTQNLVFVALVLMALAEVFRRGAALEHEQSLVI